MRVAHPRLLLAGAVAALLATTADGSPNKVPKEAGNAPPSALFLAGLSTDKLAAMLEQQRDNLDDDVYNDMKTVLNEVKAPDTEEFIKLLEVDGQGVDSIMSHPLMQQKVKVAMDISTLLDDLMQNADITDDETEELERRLAKNSVQLVQGQISLETFLVRVKNAKDTVTEDEEMAEEAGDSDENGSI
ncbi:UNVERIFIED_CONTAM: hypothetical protein HHA_205210 [Hammondia hammondi]|eukprot:XP_008887449.1 hypothetical protein HHA_205210 [Hammondia hammondi]